MEKIDTSFDFTSDSRGYWDGFWNNNDGLGAGNSDPDSSSKTLQNYHRFLWSKLLPNGERMTLAKGSGANYLTWNGFRFGSDSIMASFRYKKYRYMINRIADSIPDYKAYMENYIKKTYTIGGMIIFPKRMWGINQSRGCNSKIRDRWDLTLECIRRYYDNQDSPLYNVLIKDKDFFDLFQSFRGYVDFFYLQDCVSSDYEQVVFWEGDGDFRENPLPSTVEDYIRWIDEEIKFVEKRNRRIEEAVLSDIYEP